MKKMILYLFVLVGLLFITTNYSNTEVKATEPEMDINYNTWGSPVRSNLYVNDHVVRDGNTDYHVGEIGLDIAVYQHQYDSDENLVTYKAYSQAINVNVPYLWYTRSTDIYSQFQNISTQISDTSYIVYSGAGYSSFGFELSDFTPKQVPTSDTYSFSISNSLSISIPVTFSDINAQIVPNYAYDNISRVEWYRDSVYARMVPHMYGGYEITRGSTYYGTVGTFLNYIEHKCGFADSKGLLDVSTTHVKNEGVLYY